MQGAFTDQMKQTKEKVNAVRQLALLLYWDSQFSTLFRVYLPVDGMGEKVISDGCMLHWKI